VDEKIIQSLTIIDIPAGKLENLGPGLVKEQEESN
jgi:hypothetical protein